MTKLGEKVFVGIVNGGSVRLSELEALQAAEALMILADPEYPVHTLAGPDDGGAESAPCPKS